MKKLIAISTLVLALTTSGISAIGETPASAVAKTETKSLTILDSVASAQKAEAMNKAVKKLKSHVNKTWYVFSGASPAGWDCSGLTMWFYEQLGTQLEHRATKQQSAGVATRTPKVGDLVVFKYNGSKQAYHVGIYIGNGKMVHAPKHGHLTRIESIKTFAGTYTKVSYRTVV
jgi:cell wall-associated NlpC family hydrolase